MSRLNDHRFTMPEAPVWSLEPDPFFEPTPAYPDAPRQLRESRFPFGGPEKSQEMNHGRR